MSLASPPDLVCITPPPTNQKSRASMGIQYFSLLPFEWYSTFGEFINWSAAGPSVAQSGSVSGLLRSFVVLVDNYEMEFQNILTIRSLRHLCCMHCLVLSTLDFVTEMLGQDQLKAQGLVGTFVRSFLQEIDKRASQLPATVLVIKNVAYICHFYTAVGKANESMEALEMLISSIVSKITTVGPIPECSEESIELYDCLRICSIELAFCAAVSGDEEKATKLMNKSLGFPTDMDSIHLIASFDFACENCRNKKLREARNERFLDKRHAVGSSNQVWFIAIRVAVMIRSRRVNIDREPSDCGLQYDPVITEGTEWYDEDSLLS